MKASDAAINRRLATATVLDGGIARCDECDEIMLEDERHWHEHDPETPLERCCHILRQEGTASSLTPRVALCGFHPNDRPAHSMGSPGAVICPTCERPRCPDCVVMHSKGAR